MRSPPIAPLWAGDIYSVGVTGTNGKTTTTGMIADLLGLLARPVAAVTTLGSFLDGEQQDVAPHYDGFIETLNRCRARGGRYAALELTSEALALGFAKAWPCRVGVFTNLSHDHADAHGSVEHYLASKAQLFMSLPAEGAAILNGRDETAALLRDVMRPAVDVVTYGVPSRGDAWTELDLAAFEVELEPTGTRARLAPSRRFPDLPETMRLAMVGEIFVENALAALGAALVAGVAPAAALARLEHAQPPPGRFQLVCERPYVVVDYAHTPDALQRSLKTARALCRGRLTVVFGAGGDRDHEKRPLLGVAARGADRIVLTADNSRSEDPREIIDAIASGVGRHPGLVCEVDRARAISDAVDSAAPDDWVLIAGKGHEQYLESASGRVPFSDVAVVRRSRNLAQ